MKKKWLVIAGSLLLFTVAGVFWWTSGQKAVKTAQTSSVPLKVARYFWPGQYWKEIAKHKGWFKEAGLDVELVDTNPDYYTSLADTVAGKIDVNSFTAFDLAQYNLMGADLVVVLSADVSSGVDVIIARRGINNVLDLKGRKVGVEIGTYGEFLLDTVLDFNELSPDDVIKINVQTEKANTDFVSGVFDALVTWEPLAAEVREKAYGHTLWDSSQTPGIILSVTPFKRSFIEQHPDVVQAYVDTWHRTTRFIKEHPAESFGIISDIYNVSVQDVENLAGLDEISGLRQNVIRFTYGAGHESLYGNLQMIVSFLKRKGIVTEQVDVTDYIDTRFVRKLEQ